MKRRNLALAAAGLAALTASPLAALAQEPTSRGPPAR